MVRREVRKRRAVRRSLSSAAQFHTTPMNIFFSFRGLSFFVSISISTIFSSVSRE